MRPKRKAICSRLHYYSGYAKAYSIFLKVGRVYINYFDYATLCFISSNSIFLLFIVVMFFCSLYKRGTNFREHAVGHKQFLTATLVATIVATYCPGGVLKHGITYASSGAWYIVHRITLAFFPLLFLSWLGGRISKFIHHLSMPETMASAYGCSARLVTALFEVCSAIIMVSLQIRTISDTVCLFIPSASPLVITILITGVMLVYAMFGGVRAITFTDAWQCIIFSTLIVVLAWLVFKKTGKSIIQIINFLQAQKQFGLHSIIPSDEKVPKILRYLNDLFAPIAPYLVQHVYMCKSPVQVRKAFLYSSIFCSVIIASVTLVGLLVFVCFPYVSSTDIFHHFLSNATPLLKWIVCTIILSFAMSTVDSRLHVASIMLVYDIPRSIPLFKRLVHFYQLPIARVTLLVMGLLTMVLAFKFSIFTLSNIFIWYLRFYVPVIMAPFILAVLGLRTSSSVVLIGMATGLLSMLAWQKWMVSIVGTTTGHIPCMLMNGLVMIGLHYLLRRTTN